MNLKLILAACVLIPLTLVACSKQDAAPASEQTETSAAATDASKNAVEQQAAIDALDQPVLDENNTDSAEATENASADQATASSETKTQAAH